MSFLRRHWSLIATGLLLTTAACTSGWRLYESRHGRDCCAPGSSCCHPGSPCCAHGNHGKGA
jgi:hypothetical protein